MTNEEIQRTMELILQGQARFHARMEKDEARIARTMEFILLGQARFDARTAKDEARIARLEDAFVTLVEIARITDERQDKTDQRVDTFDAKLSALADAQLISEVKLAEVQAYGEQRLNALIDVVERYITKGNSGTPQP